MLTKKQIEAIKEAKENEQLIFDTFQRNGKTYIYTTFKDKNNKLRRLIIKHNHEIDIKQKVVDIFKEIRKHRKDLILVDAVIR